MKIAAAVNERRTEDEKLTEANFIAFCQTHYFNSHCSGKTEFVDDLKRIKYVKRLIQKIHKHKTLKSIRERLILNHIIILRNVFGEKNSARILFFKLEPKLHSYLKSFLVFLEYNIEKIPEAQYHKINTDPRIDKKLLGAKN